MPRFNQKPEDLSELFQDIQGPLANIAQKSQLLLKLSAQIQSICPDLPTDSFRLANITQNGIVIEARSPAWGQRLQFERRTIEQALCQLFNTAQFKISINIIPFGYHNPAPVEPKGKKQMSAQSAQHIAEIAEHAPEGLKAKLLRLAQHANKN